jgi:hypothetical protein
MDEQSPMNELAKPVHRTRNIAILIGVVIGLVLSVAALILIDPFGWDLLGLGPRDKAAQAMPADILFYSHLDMMNLDCETLDPIARAFSENLDDETDCVLDTWVEEVDQSMQEGLGLSFEEDVEPWLGRDIGLGMREFSLGDYGELEQAQIIAAVESRNVKAADAFLEKLRNAIAEEIQEPIAEDIYEGVRLFSVDVESGLETPLVFGRSGDVMLFGLGSEIVQAAIDAQGGVSLGDKTQYLEVTRELLPEALLTFYVDMTQYLDVAAEMAKSVYGSDLALFSLEGMDAYQGSAGSLTIVDAGIQMDIVYILDEEKLTETQQAAMASMGQAPTMGASLPQSAYLYYAGRGLDLAWQKLRETLDQASSVEEVDEAMEIFASTFGFNPDKDLFPKLDGEWAFVVLPSSTGVLAEQLDVSLGFAFLAQTSDPQGLESTLSGLEIPPAEMGYVQLEPVESAEMTLYNLVQSFVGDSLLTFGTGKGHFLIGTSTQTLESLFEEGPSLAESERYRSVWREFPAGTAPVFYFDLEGIFGQIREGLDEFDRETFDEEIGQAFGAIQFFAVGVPPAPGDAIKVSMILFVDTE